MTLSRELAVIVYLTHTKLDTLRINAQLHVDEQTSIALISADSASQINELTVSLDADWLLVVSEHESVSKQILNQIRELRKHSSDTQLIFLQEDWSPELAESSPSEFMAQLFGLSPFGLLVNRQYLVEVGGLSDEYSHAFDIELFLRRAKAGDDKVVTVPKSMLTSIDRQVTGAILGADRVVQISELVSRDLGYSSPYWLGAYAALGQKMIQQSSPDASAVESHRLSVCASGYRICRTIRPADQHLLGPHLRRSVFDEAFVRPVAADVDEAILACLGRAVERLRFPGGFRAFSLGAQADSAQLLKQLGLQQAAGPLDWLVTTPRVVEHLIVDGFAEFINPSWHQGQPRQSLMKSIAAREHGYYLSNFGLRGMLPFHDLRLPRDLDFYQSAIDHLNGRLNSNAPTVLVYIGLEALDVAVWRHVAETLSARGKRNFLIVVHLTSEVPKPMAKQEPPQRVRIRKQKNLVLAELVVSSLGKGLNLTDPNDNVRLLRLIHGLCLGVSGQPMSGEPGPVIDSVQSVS